MQEEHRVQYAIFFRGHGSFQRFQLHRSCHSPFSAFNPENVRLSFPFIKHGFPNSGQRYAVFSTVWRTYGFSAVWRGICFISDDS